MGCVPRAVAAGRAVRHRGHHAALGCLAGPLERERERILIEMLTSDRKLEASTEGSN